MKSEHPSDILPVPGPLGAGCCGALRGIRRGRSSDAEAQASAAHTFRVFVRGADTGIEEVTVLESADGWTLRGSGKLRAPVNLAMDFWEARYDRAWKPIELTINLTESAKRWSVHTTFKRHDRLERHHSGGQVQRRTQHRRRRHRRAAEPDLRRVRGARRPAGDGESRLAAAGVHRAAGCALRGHSQRDRRDHQGAGALDRRATVDAAHAAAAPRSSRWKYGQKAAACCASTFRRRCSPCCATTSRACRRASSPWRGRTTRK